jgi:hypothetical protein
MHRVNAILVCGLALAANLLWAGSAAALRYAPTLTVGECAAPMSVVALASLLCLMATVWRLPKGPS